MSPLIKANPEEYISFLTKVVNQVKEKIGKDYEVTLEKTIKNNSMELIGLVIQRSEQYVAPKIYMEPYYETYLEGISVQEIVDNICKTYQINLKPPIEDDFTFSFEEMKPFIVFRLVNYARNKKMLESVPHVRFLDLAIIFHCLIRNDNEGIGTIKITNDYVRMWKTSLDEIQELAKENTVRLFGPKIQCMDEVIGKLIANTDTDALDEDMSEFLNRDKNADPTPNMYVLSNQKGINGASCLLYEGVLKRFAEEYNCDLCILPSSIHEVILIPYKEPINKDLLTEMVKEVNRTQVADDEILSDRVYIYSRESNAITM